jgi:hypothetical protein
MTRARLVLVSAAVVLLAACNSSGTTSTPTTTAPVNINARRVALIRSATTDLFRACEHQQVTDVKHHVTSEMRRQNWKDTCAAAAAHHLRLATCTVTTHGNSATAHVRLTTDHGHIQGDLHWRKDGDSWHVSRVPTVLTGTWDHDGHHWLPAEHHDGHTSTTVPGHHGDDHTSTTVPGHHGDDHTSTTVPGHHEDDHTSTTVPGHHEDDHTSTTVGHHEDDQTPHD